MMNLDGDNDDDEDSDGGASGDGELKGVKSIYSIADGY